MCSCHPQDNRRKWGRTRAYWVGILPSSYPVFSQYDEAIFLPPCFIPSLILMTKESSIWLCFFNVFHDILNILDEHTGDTLLKESFSVFCLLHRPKCSLKINKQQVQGNFIFARSFRELCDNKHNLIAKNNNKYLYGSCLYMYINVLKYDIFIICILCLFICLYLSVCLSANSYYN